MKWEVDLQERESGYIAAITGICKTYRFSRDFLGFESRTLRRTGGRPERTRRTYTLTDGLYEVNFGDERRYWAVVNNRRISLDKSAVDAVCTDCLKGKCSLESVLQLWLQSSPRSSDTLAQVAKEHTETVKKKRRAERKAWYRRMTAADVFNGSDSAATRHLLTRLNGAGTKGRVAAQLFRCQKSSARAKRYGMDFREAAYERKADAIRELCELLQDIPGLSWGWREDPMETFARWVLYVELPQGQVSFHSPERVDGPDFPGVWDGRHASEERILAFCDQNLPPMTADSPAKTGQSAATRGFAGTSSLHSVLAPGGGRNSR